MCLVHIHVEIYLSTPDPIFYVRCFTLKRENIRLELIHKLQFNWRVNVNQVMMSLAFREDTIRKL